VNRIEETLTAKRAKKSRKVREEKLRSALRPSRLFFAAFAVKSF